MKIIVVSFFGVDDRIIATRRIKKICEYFARKNKVVLLTRKSYNNKKTSNYNVEYFPVINLHFKIKGSDAYSFKKSAVDRKKGIKFLIKKLIKNFLRVGERFFIDEISRETFYVCPDIIKWKLKKIIDCNRSEKFCLISSALPAVVHEAVVKLKKKTNFYWIADYRDPIRDNIYTDNYSKKYGENVDELVCKNANIITTVSNGLLQKVIFNQKVPKDTFVLYNGIDIEKEIIKETNLCNKCWADGRALHIGYFGSIYSGRRLDKIFEALNYIDMKISFHYAGLQHNEIDTIAKSADFLIINHGFLSKKKLDAEMNNCHVFIVLKSESKEEGGFTGKIYELLLTGKPILVVGGYDGEFNSIFGSISNIFITSYNKNDIRNAFKSIVSKKSFIIQKDDVKRITWDYQLRVLEDRLLKILDE